MANTITGRIMSLGDIETITSKNGKTFQKRQLVLNCTRSDFGQVYENFPSFEFIGKHVTAPEEFNVGEIVTVSFTLQGKRIQKDNMPDAFFNTVVGYKIEKWQRQSNIPKSKPVEPAPVGHEEASTKTDDDLPF